MRTSRDRRSGIRTVGAAALTTIVLATLSRGLAFGSQATRAPTAPEKTVRVGLYQNPPKIYRNDDDEPAGLFVRLVNAIARREHWRLQFVSCNWERCLQLLQIGGIDLMPDVAYSEKRKQMFDFHYIPVTHSWSVVLTRAGERVLNLGDLKGKRIGLLSDSVQLAALAKVMHGLGLRYTQLTYPSYEIAFQAVRDGDADAVVSNSYYAAFSEKRFGLKESPVVFDPVALYFATRKGDPLDLLGTVDTYLRQWRYDENSVYYAALSAAMVPAQEPVLPPRIRDFAFAAFGLLMLFLTASAVLRWQVRRRTLQLRESAQRLDHILSASSVVLYQLSMDTVGLTLRWVSDNVERLFGFQSRSMIAQREWPQHLETADREKVARNLAELRASGHLVQEYRIRDARGTTRFVRDEMSVLPGAPGQPDEVVGSWTDLTEAREQAARVSFLTHYDPLTRLPNRALLHERIGDAVYRARREHSGLAVFFVDIDRFKMINDSFGQIVGDAVLKVVSDRLSGLLHLGNVLARVGGNAFVILMEGDSGRGDAVATAKSIMEQFREAIPVADQQVAITLSVGISLFPENGDNGEDLLQRAEAAMYEAKRTGRNSHQMYSRAISEGVSERLSIAAGIRNAAANGELLLHYQPQVELTSRRMVGVEALVRWQHPLLGLVPPGRFIPVAEELGMIGDIGAWVLEEACRQVIAWDEEGLHVPRVSVNLSVQQIDGETLIPLVQRVLREAGLDAGRLELEVTESMIMREPARATATLEGMRALGVHLAIDDFGTGYSSLNYLKHLPINRLKIDRSFVRDIGVDRNSETISRAVIGLARSLELETVAEGVEQEAQLAFLLAEGCQVGQGYLFSRPVPASQIASVQQALIAGSATD